MSINVEEDIIDVTGEITVDTINSRAGSSSVTVEGVTLEAGGITTTQLSTFNGQIDMGNNAITNVGTSPLSTSAINRSTFDSGLSSITSGINRNTIGTNSFSPPSVIATTSVDLSSEPDIISAVYNAGIFTLTVTPITIASFGFRGATINPGSFILIKNQNNPIENGLYVSGLLSGNTVNLDRPTGYGGVGNVGEPRAGDVIDISGDPNALDLNTRWVLEGVGDFIANTDPIRFLFLGFVNPIQGSGDIQFDTNTLTISLNTPISVSSGGTGATSLTSNRVLVGNGTNVVNLTKNAPTGDFVGTTDTQTLTNKTIRIPIVQNTTGNASYTVTPDPSASNTATITIPEITGSADNFVLENVDQTLSNKTMATLTFASLNARVYNIVPNSSFLLLADTDLVIPVLESGSTEDFFVLEDAPQTLRNKILDTTTTVIRRTSSFGVDLAFDLSGSADPSVLTIASSQTSNVEATIPLLSSNDTFVFEDQSQTLTNKTLTDTTNTIAASQFLTSGTNVTISNTGPVALRSILSNISTITNAVWTSVESALFPIENRYIYLYNDTGGQGQIISNGGSSSTIIIWNFTDRIDSLYSFTNGDTFIQINAPVDGQYEVSVEVSSYIVAGQGQSRSVTQAILQQSVNLGAFTTIPGATSLMYNRTNNAGGSSCTITKVISVLSTDIYRIQVLVQRIAGLANTTIRLFNEASRIRIKRI